jgi:hypothetical protein
MDTSVPPPLGLGILFVHTQQSMCMAHRSHGLRSSSPQPPSPPPTLPPLPHPTPPNSRPEGEWACPAHKPGRKRSKELGQLERDQEIRAQAAAGGFRPKPPRTDARYQAPPAVYISGLFFLAPGTRPRTWHKTSRMMRAPLGAADERPLVPLLRPPSPPPLPLLPPLLLLTAFPPHPFLPSPRLSPRPGPGCASPPHLRPSWLMTGGVPGGHRRRGAASRVAHRGGGGGGARLASRAVRTARQEMHEIHTRALEIGSRLAPDWLQIGSPAGSAPYPDTLPAHRPAGRVTPALPFRR